MRFICSLAIAAACSLGACKGKDVTKDLEALADRGCECKDADCGRKVLAAVLKLAKDNNNATGDEDKAAAAMERMSTCILEAGLPAEDLIKFASDVSDL